MTSQSESLFERILVDGICIDSVSNRIELELSNISKRKIGELSKMKYGNLIRRLYNDDTLSIRSIEYIKIARQKENNRLSSLRYNDKENQRLATLTEDIRKLERYKNDLKREKNELRREIANYNTWFSSY